MSVRTQHEQEEQQGRAEVARKEQAQREEEAQQQSAEQTRLTQVPEVARTGALQPDGRFLVGKDILEIDGHTSIIKESFGGKFLCDAMVCNNCDAQHAFCFFCQDVISITDGLDFKGGHGDHFGQLEQTASMKTAYGWCKRRSGVRAYDDVHAQKVRPSPFVCHVISSAMFRLDLALPSQIACPLAS